MMEAFHGPALDIRRNGIMGLIQSLLGSRRNSTTARSVARLILGMERLDERIALAVDQFWVDPGSPMSSSHPTGARTDPFPSLVDAQAAIRARALSRTRYRNLLWQR